MDNKKDFNKHLEQLIDILIYDFRNKNLILRDKGIPLEHINSYMNEYERNRIDIFKNDINTLKNIYK